MNRKTIAFVLLLICGTGTALWAAQPKAVLKDLRGKVEIKAPGADDWTAATEGQTLATAVTLSTGFDSSVVVVIGENTIQVKPLTRLTIDKLVAEKGTVTTSTFLRVGSVSAEVKSADVKQDFKVKSPYSTASVRGTKFDYNGVRLRVIEGLVAMVKGAPKRDSQPADVKDEEETGDGTTADGTAAGDQPGVTAADSADVEADAQLVAGGESVTVRIITADGEEVQTINRPQLPLASPPQKTTLKLQLNFGGN